MYIRLNGEQVFLKSDSKKLIETSQHRKQSIIHLLFNWYISSRFLSP